MLKVLESITAEVLPGLHLEGNPRWMLDGKTVLMGPYHSPSEHEQHLAQTVGSTDWLWSASDELRFDQKTLILQSVFLIVPDATLPPDLSLAAWQTAPEEIGLIQLSTSQNFQLESTDFRWMDPEGRTFTCVNKRATEDVQKRLRLRIAEKLELFFADEMLCGWSLLDPEQFIVDAWEEPSPEEEDKPFMELLKDYLALVTDPYIEQMEDEDPGLRDRLLDLYARTEPGQYASRRRAILHAAIADKLDRFYDLETS